MKSHSHHPVPFLIHADNMRPDGVSVFGERACATGLWGVIPGTVLIRLALAYADKLAKFGA
jgi:2,3-bisphosphoglycerate-independent phosphoglycerate mutase